MAKIPTDKRILWEGRPSHLAQLPYYAGWLTVLAVAAYLWRLFPGYIEGLGVPAEVAQWMRFVRHGLGVVAGLALALISWRLINTHYTWFVVTPDTVFSRRNWLSGAYDTLWLNRVVDVRAERPLWLRLLGLGRVRMISLDRTDPDLVINGVRNSLSLKHLLNDLARERAAREGTRVIDTGA